MQVVAGLRQSQCVVGCEGFALVAGRFGLLARGDQFAAALGLLGAQRQLVLGDDDQLLVVEHLQIECHHVDGHILAGAFQILHGSGQIEFAALDSAVDAQALKQRHRSRDVETARLQRLRLVGVVVACAAAERYVVTDRSVEIGQAAEASGRKVVAVLIDLHGTGAHGRIVLLGEVNAIFQRPHLGAALCDGRTDDR